MEKNKGLALLPILVFIALFAGAFFEDASWVGTLMYFVGIVLIFFCFVAHTSRRFRHHNKELETKYEREPFS